MRAIDLNSLGITRDEVKAALARERRPRFRRRLIAVCRALAGNSIKQAARAAKATPADVDRWLERVRRSGFQSLLRDTRRSQPKYKMTPDQLEAMRRDIAAALQQPLKPQVRSRLVAMDMVLSGEPMDEAARSAHVFPRTLGTWLRDAIRDGFAPTLARWESQGKPCPRQLDADPVALRELAAKEKNPRIRKRMVALACLAEGMGLLDAAVSAGLSHTTVIKSMKRFREEGVAAFQDPKSAGRPRKLTSTELEEVGKVVSARPELSYADVRDLIWTRFRVRYSRGRLRSLLKAELGIEWKPARSDSGAFRSEPSRKPAQGVKPAAQQDAAARNRPRGGRPPKLSAAQLEELRDYVLKRPETSFLRLDRLVWHRFQVRYCHASLKRLLKTHFGIVLTGASKKLGEGLNSAELRRALAGATKWGTKKRLRALIELAEGAEPETVARSNSVNLETLRRWTKRYLRSRIDGPRGGASTTGDGRNSGSPALAKTS
jgi:transposase